MKNWKLILAFLGSFGIAGCSKTTETCKEENRFKEYAETHLRINIDDYRLRVEKITTIEDKLENYQVFGQKEIWEKKTTCNQTGKREAGKGEKAAVLIISNVGSQLLHYVTELHDYNCDGKVDYHHRWLADNLGKKWSESFGRQNNKNDFIGGKSLDYYWKISKANLETRTKDFLFEEADLRFDRIKNRLDFYLRREKKSSLKEEFKSFQDKYKKDSD